MPCSVTCAQHSLLQARLLVLLQPAALAPWEAAQPKWRPTPLAGEGLPAAARGSTQINSFSPADSAGVAPPPPAKPTPLQAGPP